MEEADLQIVKGCLKGDRKCQNELYQSYKNHMYLVCLRYAQDSREAGEMLQAGFTEVFLSLPKWRQEGPLGAWIRKVIVQTISINAQTCGIRNGSTDVNFFVADAPGTYYINTKWYVIRDGIGNGANSLTLIQSIIDQTKLIYSEFDIHLVAECDFENDNITLL